jgi:hypothetical protein
MANRHANKKLRMHVRLRMSATGETYQQALSRILLDESDRRGSVDLIAANYFGWPIVLAVFEATEPIGLPLVLRVPSARHWGVGVEIPTPFMSFRRGEWQ